MIYLKREAEFSIEAVNEDPHKRDGYVEVEKPNGDCRRIIITPGERKSIKLKAGITYVRHTVGTRVTCF